MRRTPRAAFVSAGYATRAYDDASIPIACHEVTTQASLSAAVIAALGLAGAEEVFEVGTGHGYQTALARLFGRVVSTGIWPDLAGQACNLAAQGIGNVVPGRRRNRGHRNSPRFTGSWSAPPTLACHRRWPPSSGRGDAKPPPKGRPDAVELRPAAPRGLPT